MFRIQSLKICFSSFVFRPRFGQKKNSLLLSKPGIASTQKPEKKPESQVKKPKPKEKPNTVFDGSQAGNVTLASKEDTVSSTDLLVRMHRRHQMSTTPVTSRNNDLEEPDPDAVDAGSLASDKDKELLEDIRYLAM